MVDFIENIKEKLTDAEYLKLMTLLQTIHREISPKVVAATESTPLLNILSQKEYYPDGSLQVESWYKDGTLHRDGDHPAVRIYYPDGTLNAEKWYRHGDLIRSYFY